MTSRPLSGEALQFRLNEEIERTMDAGILARSGRNARTLIKEGALRMTVITLAAGGGIPDHTAEGPILVHVLRGGLRFSVGDTAHELGEGDAIAIPARMRHELRSEQGASFLLIISHPETVRRSDLEEAT